MMEGLFGHIEPGDGANRYAQVVLERGFDRPEGFTYVVPDEMGELGPGDRVTVPLGRKNRPVGGYVLKVMGEAPEDVARSKLKAIAARQHRGVNLPEDLIELSQWLSRYYCCPLGMVLSTILPAAVKKGTGMVERTYVELHEPICEASVDSIVATHGLRGKQKDVLGKVVELGARGRLPVLPKVLAEMAGAKSVSPVNGLVEKGLLRELRLAKVEAIWSEHRVEGDAGLVLTDEQAAAVGEIVGEIEDGFGVNLLHGVTGSGKTEVYIRVIEEVLRRGKRAIVLVPEIALTPQTAGRFIGRFEQVAVLHSGLTAAQRHEQWNLIREGWARVVVGARSAVFAPVDDLGMIIVDEEHDGSYKQDQSPRYHARDVAVKRAQMCGARVVLGSATPSLESYYNAQVKGAYGLVRLKERVAGLSMPHVDVVDMMDERRRRYEMTGKHGVHLLSVKLENVLRRTIKEGGQAMLLLNRRGYANYVACASQACGWVMACEHCDVNMVYHVDKGLKTGGLLRCHYCGFENIVVSNCPVCSKKVTVFGLGTQRVEDEIAKKFEGLRFARMDSDVMRSSKDYDRLLDQFRSGDIQVLVGTQMIAKGLDFPNVRLVGVISADTALNMPDFRASERTFQLVCQVAGRSGRSDAGGTVVVQTFTPEHPAIQLAAEHDYDRFAEMELGLRKYAGLPPVSRMVRIVSRDLDDEKARAHGEVIGELIRRTNESLGIGARVVGSAPAPIARIGGYYRHQVEVTAKDAVGIQRLLWQPRMEGLLKSDARTAVDVDPISLL